MSNVEENPEIGRCEAMEWFENKDENFEIELWPNQEPVWVSKHRVTGK